MKTDTKAKIIELVKARGGVSPAQLSRLLSISPQAIHRHLRALERIGQVERRGAPPKTMYLAATSVDYLDHRFPEDVSSELNKSYCYFLPSGRELVGVEGFVAFLRNTDQDANPLGRAKEYFDILSKAEAFRGKHGLIDGMGKIQKTFSEVYLSRLYYSDFYSLPKYGKTRLGQYLLHGKSGQSLNMIERIAAATKKQVQQIVKDHSINAVAFAPHSIPRKVQFLDEYRRRINIALPTVTLIKAFAGSVPIAQKSLSKLSERVTNAAETIFVSDQNLKQFRNILLIDDALGSGATMNETAKKLSIFGAAVTGYAIVGSYKGFEVIREI